MGVKNRQNRRWITGVFAVVISVVVVLLQGLYPILMAELWADGTVWFLHYFERLMISDSNFFTPLSNGLNLTPLVEEPTVLFQMKKSGFHTAPKATIVHRAHWVN